MKEHQLTGKSGVFWNYAQEKGRKVSLLLYGEIGKAEQIDPANIVSQLMDLSDKFDEIDIHINSNGGDVFSGIAIYNALRLSETSIKIYIDGIAASIAGVIALCGKPLYMSQYSKLMIHSVSGGIYGNKIDLQDAISTIESLEDIIIEMISGRCKKNKAELKNLYFDGKDHWISASEALDMGLIDGILDLDDIIPAKENNNDNIYNYFNNKLLDYKKEEQDMELLNQIKKIPSFAEMQTEEQILNHIRELEDRHPQYQNAQTLVTSAVREGIILRDEANELLNLSNGDVGRLRVHIEKKKQKNQATFDIEYANLTKFKSEYEVLRNLPDSFINNELKQLASKDFSTFKKMVGSTRKKLVSEFIYESPSNNNRAGWTLDDYRKKAPKELRNNPQLYKDLLEREQQK
ncbi:head maturation protease, ClpP-related [Bacteroides sp. BFG-606]|uniref:head maturation protease, ClpP-related n=1 Tax=Bacteroides sp. BFG-606 TaxID=2972763 RepID=UPI0021660A80|nr:head maturation protease, ClpP-related [Bacteroides sp. BFG-606]MCS2335388.1 Clp protease ClpP [Bacteroides sp. BFG-606]